MTKDNASLARLTDVIDRLLAPEGCPWDKEQTPESLCDYLVEECFELVEAIRSGNADEVREEMGDVMFLLAFLGRLYADKGAFTLDDAMANNAAKMIRRHPHVFSDTTYADRDEFLRNWESIKRAEKADAEGEPQGVYDSLPASLPPLLKAYRIHSKAARVGFTWPEDEDVERQVETEWLELLDVLAGDDKAAQENELGDLIFSLVELGRRKGIKANTALDMTNLKFLRRFRRMEALARERGLDFPALSLDDKDELWNEAKAAEAAAR